MTQQRAPSQAMHAVIIWGGSEEERLHRAKSLAAARVCSAGSGAPCGVCAHCVKAAKGIHPDILIHDHTAESRLFSVAQVRAIREDAIVMPNEAAVKVYIINHADSMNAAAQNAFLKTLEEPPRGAVFYLLAESPENLLPRWSPPRFAAAGAAKRSAGRGFPVCFIRRPLPLSEFSHRLDKLSRDELRDFISQARALLLAHAQKRSAKRSALFTRMTCWVRRRVFDFNVGVVHVSGFSAPRSLTNPKGFYNRKRGEI